ncbi:MAG: hypothetical protein ACM3WV_05745 [Bacillota bacterium]
MGKLIGRIEEVIARYEIVQMVLLACVLLGALVMELGYNHPGVNDVKMVFYDLLGVVIGVLPMFVWDRTGYKIPVRIISAVVMIARAVVVLIFLWQAVVFIMFRVVSAQLYYIYPASGIILGIYLYKAKIVPDSRGAAKTATKPESK